MALRCALLFLLFLFTAGRLPLNPVVHPSSGPSTVRIERCPTGGPELEIFIDNRGATPLSLRVLQVSAFDAAGRLLLRRQLDDNGVRPSIQTLPERSIAAGQSLTVFNPFSSFGKELTARLHYQLTLADADGETEHVAGIDVCAARARQDGAAFAGADARSTTTATTITPTTGASTTASRRSRSWASRANPCAYGYDFVPGGRGRSDARGSGERNEDYFGFGADSPAAGDGWWSRW
jgi:hypothetical protein